MVYEPPLGIKDRRLRVSYTSRTQDGPWDFPGEGILICVVDDKIGPNRKSGSRYFPKTGMTDAMTSVGLSPSIVHIDDFCLKEASSYDVRLRLLSSLYCNCF